MAIKKSNQAGSFLRNHWLMLLIVLQPLLDIVAFWTKSPEGTLAGYIRLAIMLALPLWLLLRMEGRRDRLRLLGALAVIGLICLLHLLNVLRIGAASIAYELSYTAKTAQMPILAVCFSFAIRDAQTRNQAYWGLFFAAAITALALGLSILTGTANVTYGEGLGISGWVISDNRTANSTILVVLAAFSIFCAVKSDKPAVNILVPILTACVLMINGTMTCYLSIFLIFFGFALFLPLEQKIRGCRVNRLAVWVVVVTALLSAAAYPLTPKYKIKQAQSSFMEKTQTEFEETFGGLNMDLGSLSKEKILSDPALHKLYSDYYWKCLWNLCPDMFERFEMDEIMLKYDLTTDASVLLNTRNLKRVYMSLVWDHSDGLTHLLGIDCSSAWLNGKMDLENDWPAIWYYYGYLGFTAYAAFILYYLWLILRRLRQDFRSAFTADNFILLVCFLLLIGIAQFSGAVLRRPNVSVYLSLILGLIHYQTVRTPVGRASSWRGEWI